MLKAEITIRAKNRKALLEGLKRVHIDIQSMEEDSVASFVDQISYGHGEVDNCYSYTLGEDHE